MAAAALRHNVSRSGLGSVARLFSTRPSARGAEATAGWQDSARQGLVGAVGKTPLIRLKGLSEETGCEILAKAEFMNPGGSVKDRAALFLVQDAERRGLLKPGGTVVEGTAGNTGIGLAHICNSLGYECVIYMPDTQSQEKIDTLRILGADVRPVPAVAFSNPDNYNHQAARFAESLENAVWTNQFDNTANRLAHVETTGPEIWQQTGGAVSAFTCATGTGGTLAGVAEYLKQKKPDVNIVLADPPGSVLYNYVQSGKLERKGDGSITEGIGQGRVTDNLAGALIDDSVFIPDEDSIAMAYRMLHEEGLCIGASSALNVCAALEVAKTMGPGNTVTTMMCDSGFRYSSRLFNKTWLDEKGLLSAVPEEQLAKLP